LFVVSRFSDRIIGIATWLQAVEAGMKRMGSIEASVWHYLYERLRSGAGSPSVREVAEACFCDVATVYGCLVRLEARGLIEFYYSSPGRRAARGVKRVKEPPMRE
jgi:DNA-binding MarR family transcriptional regulator